MINPDDKHKDTTTAEIGGDEREADELNDTVSEERAPSRPRCFCAYGEIRTAQ